jgi:hypothetical protein
VDRDKMFTPMRVITKGQDLVKRYTDHLSNKISLCGLPSSKGEVLTKTKWNLMKPGGWEKYGQATDDIAGKVVDVVDVEKDIYEVIRKIDKLQDKAKYIAFDKTKITHKKSTSINKDENSIETKEVLKRQSEQLEREILEIRMISKEEQQKCSR